MKSAFKKISLIAVIALIMISVTLPLIGCENITGDHAATPNPTVHLIEESEKEENPVRYIDSVEERAMSAYTDSSTTSVEYFRRQTELYNLVVIDGYRPSFTVGDPLLNVYNGAIAILNRYIRNDWTEYQRVHVIHDFLVSQVTYDFTLYNDFVSGGSMANSDTNDAFNLSGVFVKRLAVCDGISKSAAFLCALEGIEATRVTGDYFDGKSESPHAWNKVLLNLNGTYQWYAFDATMDMISYEVTGADGSVTSNKVLSHAFFLRSDEIFDRTHARDAVQPFDHACPEDFNYFADKYISIGGEFYRTDIKSVDDLNEIFRAVQSAGREVGKFEIKLSFEATNFDYSTYMQAAYANVLMPDSTSWIQLGADVVMCLVYL